MPPYRLAGEIAEASRIRSGKQKRSPNELVATARSLERLLARRRKLNAELRRLERNIKHERKMLKALAGAEDDAPLDTPMPEGEQLREPPLYHDPLNAEVKKNG